MVPEHVSRAAARGRQIGHEPQVRTTIRHKSNAQSPTQATVQCEVGRHNPTTATRLLQVYSSLLTTAAWKLCLPWCASAYVNVGSGMEDHAPRPCKSCWPWDLLRPLAALARGSGRRSIRVSIAGDGLLQPPGIPTSAQDVRETRPTRPSRHPGTAVSKPIPSQVLGERILETLLPQAPCPGGDQS